MTNEMLTDNAYIPDWYIGEPDKKRGLRNISRIRKVSEEALEQMTY